MKIIKMIVMLLCIFAFETFAQVELDKMPSIKGGINELAKNIKYPESAKIEGIVGTVIVQALIDKNGDVIKTKVLKSVDKDLDAAGINAIKKTKFVPGMKDGKMVQAEVTIPIKFKLDDC